jgi:hypothetical protein
MNTSLVQWMSLHGTYLHFLSSRGQQRILQNSYCREYFFQVGFSELIFSDRAKEFLSTIIKVLTRLTVILQRATTGYQSKANGLLERAHAFLGASLAIYTKKTNAFEWSRFLPSVIFWSRVAQHAFTGYLPCYLMFGREPMLPLDICNNTLSIY